MTEIRFDWYDHINGFTEQFFNDLFQSWCENVLLKNIQTITWCTGEAVSSVVEFVEKLVVLVDQWWRTMQQPYPIAAWWLDGHDDSRAEMLLRVLLQLQETLEGSSSLRINNCSFKTWNSNQDESGQVFYPQLLLTQPDTQVTSLLYRYLINNQSHSKMMHPKPSEHKEHIGKTEQGVVFLSGTVCPLY